MGSSHMEAMQVMPKDNTTNILCNLSSKKIYNIGMSSHYLLTCASNLKNAMKKYRPLQYVIIETPRIRFYDEDLSQLLIHNVPKVGVKERGTLRLFLRKNPYLYIIWTQVKKFFPDKNQTHNQFTENNPELLSQVFQRMHDTVSKSGAKLIIAYHPPVSLNQDGTLKIESNPEVVKQFSELCTENGIYFLDMSERFLTEYEKDFTLPYGFFNTSVAKGHMNKDGHRMFAEEIYKLMQRIEGK